MKVTVSGTGDLGNVFACPICHRGIEARWVEVHAEDHTDGRFVGVAHVPDLTVQLQAVFTWDDDQLAAEHLRTTLHGFADWDDEDFSDWVNAHGGPVKYHERDHVNRAGEFTDPDMPEHQHTHPAGDPLRTWDGAA